MNGHVMKLDHLLMTTSLLAIVLLTFHLADDVAFGFEPGGLKNLIGTSILAVWLCAALMLTGRRIGYLVLLLGSLLTIVVPVVHFRGAGVSADIAKGSGGFFFVWTLIALGTLGPVSLVLSAIGLWRARRGSSAAMVAAED